MADEYLWDRTGPPEQDVAELEELLGRFRYRARQPGDQSRFRLWLAVAASLTLIASVAYWRTRQPMSDWQVDGRRVAVGATIETAGNISKTVEALSVGEVTLSPNSTLQILPAGAGRQRLALKRGTMEALIYLPPARFVVETPTAKTIDLGCAYRLTVLDDGAGLLSVQTGWVAFQAGAIESFIPAGAACRTRPRLGPGLPYFEDAPAELQAAVAQFETTRGQAGLDELLAHARKKDALTLWHLVLRTTNRDRDRVVRQLTILVPGVDAAGLRSGNAAALDAAWNLLGLGGADWWRIWKQSVDGLHGELSGAAR